MSGSPSCPSTSISATDHCRPFGSATTWRCRYFQSSIDHMSVLDEQLFERARDLRTAEGLWNQEDVLCLAGAEAGVGLLGRVADDDDGQRGVVRVAAHAVEHRFAHLEHRAVEDQRVRPLVCDEVVDLAGEAAGDDLVAVIAERKGQQLRDLRRVVDKEDSHGLSPKYQVPRTTRPSAHVFSYLPTA